jgi:L-fuculose-phosphate aldolase
MNYRKILVEAGQRMYQSQLTVETWGNISICDREKGLVYITPSGMNYLTVTEEDMVVLDMQAKRVEGFRKSSIETPMHVAVFNARQDVDAVIHAHPLYSTAFSSMGENIPLIHDEAAQTLGDVIRTAEYALPGTLEIANNCVKSLGTKAKACLLRSHGSICIGKDMDECFKVATVLEMVARIYYLIRSMGGKYIPISDENIAAMQEFIRTGGYGQGKE